MIENKCELCNSGITIGYFQNFFGNIIKKIQCRNCNWTIKMKFPDSKSYIAHRIDVVNKDLI